MTDHTDLILRGVPRELWIEAAMVGRYSAAEYPDNPLVGLIHDGRKWSVARTGLGNTVVRLSGDANA